MERYGVKIITFGCQMNENDSIQLRKILTNKKIFFYEDNIEKADVVILNTCSVREKPEHKVFSEVGRIGRKGKIIGVIGCVAQEYGEKLLDKSKYINFVAGTHNIDKVPDILLKVIKKEFQKMNFTKK